MGAFEAIVVLCLIGLLMIGAEVFIPGLVLGILGGLCLLGAVAVAYVSYGAITGTFFLIAISVLAMVGFIVWMYAFPHTPIGKGLMLKTSLDKGTSPRTQAVTLLGLEGYALTPLRPSGTASLGGKKVDVVAESDFISPEDKVVVVREEGMRIVVRKKE